MNFIKNHNSYQSTLEEIYTGDAAIYIFKEWKI